MINGDLAWNRQSRLSQNTDGRCFNDRGVVSFVADAFHFNLLARGDVYAYVSCDQDKYPGSAILKKQIKQRRVIVGHDANHTDGKMFFSRLRIQFTNLLSVCEAGKSIFRLGRKRRHRN